MTQQTVDVAKGVIVFDGTDNVGRGVYKKEFGDSIVVASTGPRGATGEQGEEGPVYDPNVRDLSLLMQNGMT